MLGFLFGVVIGGFVIMMYYEVHQAPIVKEEDFYTKEELKAALNSYKDYLEDNIDSMDIRLQFGKDICDDLINGLEGKEL